MTAPLRYDSLTGGRTGGGGTGDDGDEAVEAEVRFHDNRRNGQFNPCADEPGGMGIAAPLVRKPVIVGGGDDIDRDKTGDSALGAGVPPGVRDIAEWNRAACDIPPPRPRSRLTGKPGAETCAVAVPAAITKSRIRVFISFS